MAVVYTHQRLDNNEVFYVGIGKEDKRAYSKNGRREYWKRIVEKYGYTIDIKVNDCSWDEAKEIEKYLIAFYGRKDLGLGNLVNMTDGGDGLLGCKSNLGKKHSDEHKKKISEAMKGEKNHNFGKTLLKETKNKMSEAHKGFVMNEKQKEKLRKANLGKKLSPESIAKRTASRKANKLKKLNII